MKVLYISVLVLAASLLSGANGDCTEYDWDEVGPDGWYPGGVDGGLGTPFTDSLVSSPRRNRVVTVSEDEKFVYFDTQSLDTVDGDYCVRPCTELPCTYWTAAGGRKTKKVATCGDIDAQTEFLDCISTEGLYCADCAEELEKALAGESLSSAIGSDYDDGDFNSMPEGATNNAYPPEILADAIRKRARRQGIEFTGVEDVEHAGGRRPLSAATSSSSDSSSSATPTTTSEETTSLSNFNASVGSANNDNFDRYYNTIERTDGLRFNLAPSTRVTFKTNTANPSVTIASRFFLCAESATACYLSWSLNDAVYWSKTEFRSLDSCNIMAYSSFDPANYRLSVTHDIHTDDEEAVWTSYLAYYCEGDNDLQLIPNPLVANATAVYSLA